MKTLEPLIEECREKLGGISYYKTMLHLGMNRQAWTAIQNGAGVSDKNALRIAEFLNMDELYVVAISKYCSTSDRGIKSFWRKVIKEREPFKKKQENFRRYKLA